MTDNMIKGQNPYLEEPKTFDPAINNKDDLEKGGGGSNGQK